MSRVFRGAEPRGFPRSASREETCARVCPPSGRGPWGPGDGAGEMACRKKRPQRVSWHLPRSRAEDASPAPPRNIVLRYLTVSLVLKILPHTDDQTVASRLGLPEEESFTLDLGYSPARSLPLSCKIVTLPGPVLTSFPLLPATWAGLVWVHVLSLSLSIYWGT